MIHSTYTREQLLAPIPASNAVARRVQKSFHPERSGDVLVVLKPYFILSSRKAGTMHGSPHPHDTHVPLVFFGPGFKSEMRTDPITPQALAATLARAIGISAPARAEAAAISN
jgi:hypothetical protein